MFGDKAMQFKYSRLAFEKTLNERGPAAAIENFRRAYKLHSKLSFLRPLERVVEFESTRFIDGKLNISCGKKRIPTGMGIYRFRMKPLVDVEIKAKNLENAQHLAAIYLNRTFTTCLEYGVLECKRVCVCPDHEPETALTASD